MVPSTAEQPVGSCDSSPLIAGSEEHIDSPVSHMGYDEFTQYGLPTVLYVITLVFCPREVDYTTGNISLSPDRGLTHHYGNSDFTNEMGERIER